jgi:S-formylglutathione hydrolase FrmB
MGSAATTPSGATSFLPERVDEPIARGEILPLIVVMPDGGGPTHWANWSDGGPRWADYVAYDVVQTVHPRYRTVAAPESRAIGGLSMGGLGALTIALQYPDVFGVVGGHRPSLRLEPDPPSGSWLGTASINTARSGWWRPEWMCSG